MLDVVDLGLLQTLDARLVYAMVSCVRHMLNGPADLAARREKPLLGYVLACMLILESGLYA